MKTLFLYVLAVAWCACWFCGCGKKSDQTITISQTQNVNEEAGDFDPCLDCKGTLPEIESCLDRYGLDAGKCGEEEGEEEE